MNSTSSTSPNQNLTSKRSLSLGSLFSFHLYPILFDPARRWGNQWCVDESGSTILDVFWGSNYELRNSVDCSYGCLGGPGIFLQSSIFLRILIFACREGEAVGVMIWLFPLPALSEAFTSQLFLVQLWVHRFRGLFPWLPWGSRHIPRKFYPAQNSHFCLRRRRSRGGHGLACHPSLSEACIPQLVKPSYEPRYMGHCYSCRNSAAL